MIGVAFNTLEIAVSPTARVAAFLLLPNGSSGWLASSRFCFVASDSLGKTLMPCLISSPRIKKTLSTPALATATKGTSLPSVVRAAGLNRLRRGTIEFKPTATPQLAPTAVKYDCTMVDVDMGVLLFALEKLIPTLRDWFATCHAIVPVLDRLGVSIPAVTTRLESTKQDIRNGRNTGSPVSRQGISLFRRSRSQISIPGCKVESTIFFACHSSGVIEGILPCLY